MLAVYYFGQRPVLLSLVYYECPMLCNLVLNGMVRSFRALALDVGGDFEVVTVSIDPSETSELAARKKDGYLAGFKGTVDRRVSGPGDRPCDRRDRPAGRCRPRPGSRRTAPRSARRQADDTHAGSGRLHRCAGGGAV